MENAHQIIIILKNKDLIELSSLVEKQESYWLYVVKEAAVS